MGTRAVARRVETADLLDALLRDLQATSDPARARCGGDGAVVLHAWTLDAFNISPFLFFRRR